MTVIHNFEMDNHPWYKHHIKDAIINNDQIEEKLHVIAVISNPWLFKKRYKLMKEFIQRMEKEQDVILYIVELAYKDQGFYITQSSNKQHLQIRTECALWHKENMINLAVKYLLPTNYKAFAWIDADIEFESYSWAKDTLKVLNGYKDIVQLFSHCMDMDENEDPMNIVNSGGYMHCSNKPYRAKGKGYWHPGYAWAMTRKAYERIGGLFQDGILGSGDYIMMMSILQLGDKAVHKGYNEGYKNSILNFQKKAQYLRFGYIPGMIRHYFHGSKKNRRYSDRHLILIKYDYSPRRDITFDEMGIIIPSSTFPEEFKKTILDYFLERNEDE